VRSASYDKSITQGAEVGVPIVSVAWLLEGVEPRRTWEGENSAGRDNDVHVPFQLLRLRFCAADQTREQTQTQNFLTQLGVVFPAPSQTAVYRNQCRTCQHKTIFLLPSMDTTPHVVSILLSRR
jgi:hypothetical protein